MGIVQNGNKITVTVASAAAVTIVSVGAGAYLHDTTVIVSSIAAFFSFLGGMMMGKQL